MNNPVFFGQQQFMNHFNLHPSSVKGQANSAVQTHKRYLYTKLYSVYEFSIPDNWALNWFRFWLFQYGSVAAIYTREFGWLCMPYTITGLDVQYQPSSILVYNHFFDNPKAGKIGVNAQIIHLMDDFFSLDDLICKYAEELASIDKDFNVNLMNCNVALIAEAANKKDADAIQEAFAEATTGKPMVALNQNLLKGKQLTTFIQSPRQNYIGEELIRARRNVVNQFLTDIGIPNFNMEKKAQQNNAEIAENDYETTAVCSVILKNLQEDFSALNRISGLNCAVNLRPRYLVGSQGGGGKNGTDNTMGYVPI